MWSLETYARDGRRWCYTCSSHCSGPTLAVLHGVLRGWNYMLPLTSQLANSFELCALDQRGHGLSDRAERYHTVDYVADAVAWLRDAVGRPTTIYGHSLGAMVAAGAAAACPELVRGLILEDPPFHTLGNRIAQTSFLNYFRALAPFVGSTERTPVLARRLAELTYADTATGATIRLGDVRDPVSLRFFAASLRRCDPKVVEPIIAGTWLDGYDYEQVLRGLKCPVLLLQADPQVGGMLTDEDMARISQWVPELLHIRMPGVGHAMHWQRTQEIVNHTIAFVESLDGDR
jgi:pimeloyl-ACP methyl ester carboxylesterase